MAHNRLAGAPQVLVRVARAQRVCLFERQADRDVPRQRIVRRGLVGDEIERLAPSGKLRHDLGRVPEEPDRERPALRGGLPHEPERLVERLARPIEIPRLETPLDPRGIDLDAQDRRTRHRRARG